jgi:hypothetical protein
MDLCILYYTILSLHVLGAICTHHQQHKLQSTAVVTRDCYGVLEVKQSIGAGCGYSQLVHVHLVGRSIEYIYIYIYYQDVWNHEYQVCFNITTSP